MIGMGSSQENDVIEHARMQFQRAIESPSDEERELFLRNIDPERITGAQLAGYTQAVLSMARLTKVENCMDIVGTGGDGLNTINVSTAASFVVSGLGYNVVKHGNFGSSNRKGSADFLKYFGYNFNLDSRELKRRLGNLRFAFILAPMYNDSFARFAQARRNIPHRTIMNYLGPVTNPASPDKVMLGAASSEIQNLYAQYMLATGKDGFAIHSMDGMDEVSPSAECSVLHVRDGKITHFKIIPEEIIGHRIDLDAITTPIPEKSFRIAEEGLKGLDTHSAEFISLNAACAISAATGDLDIRGHFRKAMKFISSGAAYDHFRRVMENA